MAAKKPPAAKPSEKCEHGLRLFTREGEQVCALEYLNRFVAPRRVENVLRSGRRLYLVFDTGEKLECCCENCGESHGDDHEFSDDIKDVTLGRRALRFRLEDESGHLVVWFARGDHLHLHRKALERFHPGPKSSRRTRSVRPPHSPPTGTPSETT